MLIRLCMIYNDPLQLIIFTVYLIMIKSFSSYSVSKYNSKYTLDPLLRSLDRIGPDSTVKLLGLEGFVFV